MTEKSYICRYIAEHPDDWEERLSQAPYYIKIKRDEDFENLCIFNYNQYDSDFTNPVVQEARGIIIDVAEKRVECWPYRKFANYGESYADEIDWATARVTEKIDGSIVKLWYYEKREEWVLSTNGIIDAKKVIDGGVNNKRQKSFYELFKEVDTIEYSKLDKDNTYIFELCTPETRVIVPWEKSCLYHTGTRNRVTGEELITDVGVQHPKEYPLTSLDECLKAAKALQEDVKGAIDPDDVKFEGYVVNDSKWNRVKIKSYAYVYVHYLATNTIKKIDAIKLCLAGETEEYLTYFPQQTETVLYYKEKVEKGISYMEGLYREAKAKYEELGEDRVAFGKWMKGNEYSGSIFGMLYKGQSAKEVIEGMSRDKLIGFIEAV